LFFCGMSFAYFIVFPVVFGFITASAPQGVAVMTDIEKYLSFALTMFVAFGVTFQVPVAVVLMVRMGVVSTSKLKEIRPYVIVGAFIAGAIFTPPDVVSQFMLAMPLWLLYEAGIVVAGWATKKSA
jgi:sec-independent protein translocase protein TatC